MPDDVLVTVITPCYNSEKTIKRTIESVLNQTYKNIEYIIIDGNSTDNTVDVVKNYQKNFPERIRYISESDSGVYDAMNKGIKMAKGDIIGIINSDDWYEKDAIINVIDHISLDKCQVIYGMTKVYKNDQEFGVFLKHHQFIHEQMILHPSCFISSKTYEIYGLYNTKFKSSADYEFMLRLSSGTNTEFVPLYKIVANFSLGGISSGTIGTLETAKIKYNYGIISKINLFKISQKVRIVDIYRIIKSWLKL